MVSLCTNRKYEVCNKYRFIYILGPLPSDITLSLDTTQLLEILNHKLIKQNPDSKHSITVTMSHYLYVLISEPFLPSLTVEGE